MTSLREAWQVGAAADSRQTRGPPPASAPVEMNIGPPPSNPQQPAFLVGSPSFAPVTRQEWVPAPATPVETLESIKKVQQDQTGALLYSMQNIVSNTEAYLQQRIHQVKRSVDQVRSDVATAPVPASKKDVQLVMILSCLILVLILILFGTGLFMQRKSFQNLQSGLKNLTLRQIKVQGLHDLLQTGRP